ncbi:NADP-dependent oxidoreductase [Bradyrhizobium roseum]|uniref:NADP-dependent oxidoreductase n=1 Tax=Bradyrhizobium roseum TaxID=3056648 RepID=UPI0026305EA8|nr:NADP-dependent oxidoreductase [Bradyrhizobium roseus]WKA27719.1 NADP-dependent oxidoreductase [Bradyrhizobium roseus]
MRAFLLDGYGAIADHVRLAEIAEPMPGSDDVLIDIHAASLNPIDFKIVHGDLKRVSNYRLPRPFGFDASGIVLAAGARAARFKPGDAVYARAPREAIGTFAEKIALSEKFVALKPAAVSYAQAAALPLVGLTTLQGFSRVKAHAGQRILIHAGSGGIGTFAIQYAKHLGLEVTTTTSSKNVDFVKSLGADRVIAYDRENYLDVGGGYDIVYDTLGGAFTVDAFKVVKRGGTVISLSGPPDRDFARREGKGFVVRAAIWLMSRSVYAASAQAGASYCWFFTEPSGEQLREIADLVDRGAIKPVIDREFAFEQLPDALSYLEAGRARGKVVLKVK